MLSNVFNADLVLLEITLIFLFCKFFKFVFFDLKFLLLRIVASLFCCCFSFPLVISGVINLLELSSTIDVLITKSIDFVLSWNKQDFFKLICL